MNLIARGWALLSRQPFTILLSALVIAVLIGPIAAQSPISLYINRITISVVFFTAMSTLLGASPPSDWLYSPGDKYGRDDSDSALARMLKTEGISIARRTVAKYREAMRILPSDRRKRMF